MSEHIGLVTVLYNCEEVLQDFFETLEFQTYKDFELIVVDNMSQDGSLEACKSLAAAAPFRCYFIENKDNLGIAAGNNQGIRLALEHNCSKILLTNNDIVLERDTIQKLYDRHIAAAVELSVPKIYYANTNKIWCAGGWYSKWKGMAYHCGVQKDDDGQFDKERLVSYSPTCFMLINSSVFSHVGYMDEKYFVYWDDTDFVYRCVFLSGLKLLYVPAASIQHKVSSSTGVESDFTVYHVYRNRIYFARKFTVLPALYYLANIIFHYVFRKVKLAKNPRRFALVGKAMKDGWKL